MVEGREGQHRPDRLELREGQPPAGTCRAAHGNLLAGLRAEMLDAQADAIDGPIGLDERIDQRLAALAGGLQGQVIAARLHQICRAAKDFDSPRRAEPGVAIAKQPLGRRQGLLGPVEIDLIQRGDQRLVQRGADLARRCGSAGSGDHEWKVVGHKG